MRKFSLALAALAAVGTVALAPEPASARPWGWHGGGWHGGWHGGWGWRRAGWGYGGWGWRRPGWGWGVGAGLAGFGVGLATGAALARPAYAYPAYYPAYPVVRTRVVYAAPVATRVVYVRPRTRVVYVYPRRSRVVYRAAYRPYSVTTVRRVVYR